MKRNGVYDRNMTFLGFKCLSLSLQKTNLVEFLNKIIDLTYLKPDTTRGRIKQLCEEAQEFDVFSVCVPPYFVQQAARLLENQPTKICTVIGFPYGYDATQVKAEAIKKAVQENVDEIDVVANIAAIKSGDWAYIANDADSMTRLGHMRNLTVKWIIEMNLLTEDEIARMCEIAVDKEVDFVKTSTGTVGSAVTVEDIQLLRRLLPETMQIKASGGIRTREQAIALVEAGANRLGTSVIKPLMA